MSLNDQDRRRAADDRAALREELAREEAGERLEVFDALSKESDDADEELPPMPDDLRDRLTDKFGPGGPAPADPVRRSGQGLPARLRQRFVERPLAWSGGLAAAACAVLLVSLLPLGPGGHQDPLRGGGTPTPDEVALYLYPAVPAEALRALMNPDREVTLCGDVSELRSLLAEADAEWAVAADVEQRIVTTWHRGERRDETRVEGSEPADLLIELRAAIDAIASKP